MVGSEVGGTERSLDVLAKTVWEEHELALQNMQAALQHAINAGEALLEAKEEVERDTPGAWGEWVKAEAGISTAAAGRYMRIAHYKHELPDWVGSIGEARKALAGLPRIDTRSGPRVSAHIRYEAKHMLDMGERYEKIAEDLGVSWETVKRWDDPQFEEKKKSQWRDKNRKRKEAEEELERKRRQQAAKRAGGNVSKSYSSVRKAAYYLDLATSEANNREAAAKLREALDSVYMSEDAIQEAIKVGEA